MYSQLIYLYRTNHNDQYVSKSMLKCKFLLFGHIYNLVTTKVILQLGIVWCSFYIVS